MQRFLKKRSAKGGTNADNIIEHPAKVNARGEASPRAFGALSVSPFVTE